MLATLASAASTAQTYLKASEAMAEARRELVQGLVSAASDAFTHPDLTPREDSKGLSAEGEDNVAKDVSEVGEILSQLSVAEGMQLRQVQSLVLEPLQKLLDDPRGLGCISRLYTKFGGASSEFYESFQARVCAQQTATRPREHAACVARRVPASTAHPSRLPRRSSSRSTRMGRPPRRPRCTRALRRRRRPR